ncbi:MAG: endo-1,4-beta-xylanase [Lachnospiraceae bacterium]|nr:endo-1,4-beta-xylanase [Lachnospiraceae bacterium]
MDFSHRKVSKVIKLTNENNEPLKNEKVRIALKKHEFLFGCGAFDTMPYMMAKDPALAGRLPSGIFENKDLIEKAEDGMKKWLDLFNYGTLPFYWGNYEREEGKTDEELLLSAAKFLQSKGVTVKGHPLCWHTVCAPWLMDYDNSTIMKKQLDRIEREINAFKGVIDMWDVINEVVIMPIFDKYDNAITRICKEKGRVGLIKEVFDKAYSCNPNATFLINDFNTSISYEILIDGCLSAGVPISAIGIQSHQHQGYWGREKVEEVLERFSHFGLPIHFTENTFVSGDLIPEYIEDLNDWQVPEWPSTPEGEERQADNLKEMYSLLFAHPQVKAITTWDFKDGAWLGAPSGFLRKDGSLKPAYETLYNLVKKEWSTDEILTTDENGFVKIDAFKGDYIIEAAGKSMTAKFAEDGEEKITI